MLKLMSRLFYVGYPGSGLAYFPWGFAHKGDQNWIKRDQDRTRRARTNALFTFLLMSSQTQEKSKIRAKYNEKKPETFSKCHHDSLIEGIKTSNTYRPIELDELVRMDSFLLKFHACISRNTSKISDFLENSITIRLLRGRKPQTYIDR